MKDAHSQTDKVRLLPELSPYLNSDALVIQNAAAPLEKDLVLSFLLKLNKTPIFVTELLLVSLPPIEVKRIHRLLSLTMVFAGFTTGIAEQSNEDEKLHAAMTFAHAARITADKAPEKYNALLERWPVHEEQLLQAIQDRDLRFLSFRFAYVTSKILHEIEKINGIEKLRQRWPWVNWYHTLTSTSVSNKKMDAEENDLRLDLKPKKDSVPNLDEWK